jgi:Lrp/AsnC family transcriptional regulator for asnA, asnC and gidA
METANLDLRLIHELQRNGRENYVNLASNLGVTEGTIRYRLKHLLSKNLIKIVALPNFSKLGYSCTAIVGIQVSMADIRNVASDLAQKPQICYLTSVAGRYDLIAIIVTKTTKELSDFIELDIIPIPGIIRTETFIGMNAVKGESGLLDTTGLTSTTKE